MKYKATLDDAHNCLEQTILILKHHLKQINPFDSEQIKLAHEYYKWTGLKTNLIMNEKSFQIPATALPNTIKLSDFRWLYPEKQSIICKYYQYDQNTNQYIISVKKDSVPDEAVELIMRSLVLIRKAVIWVDFGYNIGSEFGGKHPAIILKNLKDSLIVIPLSSQPPNNPDYNVFVEKIYGFPIMPRWANVTRITQISISRVHFEKIGDVKPAVLSEISTKLKCLGII